MTEPGAGSDVAGMATTAVEDGDAVVLNGSKTFISNGVICDLVVLAAKDPAVENKHQAVSLYVVEAGTPGFEKGTQLEKMGWHSQDTAELFFTNCRIPKRNRLGEKGAGFFMLMGKLQQERLVCCMGGVVAAERNSGIHHGALPPHDGGRQTAVQIPGRAVRPGGDGHRSQTGPHVHGKTDCGAHGG
jgi:acyl-CoA dehydrogenase